MAERLTNYDPSRIPETFEDRSFSTLRANVAALTLVAPVAATATAAFGLIHGWPALIADIAAAPIYVPIAILLAGIVAHELLHLAAWQIVAKPPSGSVRLGFHWKSITPYAHCSAPMTARAYTVGAAMPGILLGVIPMIVGLVTGSGGWMCFGVLFTIAAGGDALILWLLRGVAGDRLVLDHPTRPGCLLLHEGSAADSVDE